jgi:hypothetical protein
MFPGFKEEGLLAGTHILLVHYIGEKYTENVFSAGEVISQFVLLPYWLTAGTAH